MAQHKAENTEFLGNVIAQPIETLANGAHDNVFLLGITALLVAAGFILYRKALSHARLQRLYTLRTLLAAVRKPLIIFGLLFVVRGTILAIPLPGGLNDLLAHVLKLALIANTGWLIISLLKGFSNAVSARYDMEISDNLQARKVHTQIKVLYRVLAFLVGLVTVAFMLMTFEGVADIGQSLLASAGVAGIVLGFAAQKTLGSVFAGIQIAITQPIRIEDAVVVEGEWGWIEEITFTYVVIRIWDKRRLIIPITYFTENPFQNWTRNDAEIIGTVVLHLDYTVPMVELRQEFNRLLDNTSLWNGNVKVVQVIDTTELTITIRCLMTAKDSPTTWDLRCYVREGLINWLQNHYPQSLPRTRLELNRMSDSNMKEPSAEAMEQSGKHPASAKYSDL
jgi:small-conductance mechanosensitive channel